MLLLLLIKHMLVSAPPLLTSNSIASHVKCQVDNAGKIRTARAEILSESRKRKAGKNGSCMPLTCLPSSA